MTNTEVYQESHDDKKVEEQWTRRRSQIRKFAPILIITEAKKLICFCANKLCLSIRCLEIL